MATEARRILLVDDDVDFVEINRRILEAKGYRIEAAYDPEDALAKCAAFRPHLVITDLMMKSLDAWFSFSRRIKEDPQLGGVRVIMVTSVTSSMGLDFRPRSAEDLKAMCADAYFDKPVAPQALLAKVQELLAEPAA
ncbi:MAG: response regulator [Planctomycetota bacterium]|nr:response regulator [Planctomycetota bacterium]